MAKKKTKAAKKQVERGEAVQRPFEALKELAKKKREEEESKSGPPAKAKATKKAEPPRKTEEEEETRPIDPDTFAIYMAGVKALAGKSTRIPATASKLEKTAQAAARLDLDAPARASMRSLVTEGIRFESIDDGERIEGRRVDVDPRELRRLRRGAYATDGKLDLHGLGTDEARRAVEAFVKKRGTDGDKVVLIVHGKGRHSPRGICVLRGEIAAWLSQGRAARHVLAFATASEADGGAGALLVLLAR